jgi:hypothetical protein
VVSCWVSLIWARSATVAGVECGLGMGCFICISFLLSVGSGSFCCEGPVSPRIYSRHVLVGISRAGEICQGGIFELQLLMPGDSI